MPAKLRFDSKHRVGLVTVYQGEAMLGMIVKLKTGLEDNHSHRFIPVETSAKSFMPYGPSYQDVKDQVIAHFESPHAQ